MDEPLEVLGDGDRHKEDDVPVRHIEPIHVRLAFALALVLGIEESQCCRLQVTLGASYPLILSRSPLPAERIYSIKTA